MRAKAYYQSILEAKFSSWSQWACDFCLEWGKEEAGPQVFFHSYLPSALPACREAVDSVAGLIHPSRAPVLPSMVHGSGGCVAAAFVVPQLTGPSIPRVSGVLRWPKQTQASISVCYPCIIVMQRMIIFLKDLSRTIWVSFRVLVV